MEKIRQNTIVSQVMDHMKQLIADGVYSPGDKIPTEQELAQELGVGRSSIREAIKIFNHLGVMESKSALGTFICERSKISKEALTWALLLGDDEIDEVIELRGAIELWSFIRLTMLNETQPELVKPHMDQLSVELERMKESIEAGRQQDLIEADYNFHL
ncbi:MAG: FadR/GntR family transcriptional regulator, partial [Spirochaetaceae bacterium]